MENTFTVALIGNPNCGKTTLFNALTGNHQRVGNWPGVTVEKKTGSFKAGNYHIELIDLPGTYGLHADTHGDSLDEQIAQEYIQEKHADIVINVIDASSIDRGLFLTSQLLSDSTPVIVALNMMDVAQSKGIDIDVEKLRDSLECPVIEIIASRYKGIDELKNNLAACLDAKVSHDDTVKGPAMEDIQAHYAWVDSISNLIKSKDGKQRKTMSERIDDVVLNRFLGIPIFLAVMYMLFMFSVNVGTAFQDFFDIIGGTFFVDVPHWALNKIGAPGWLIAFLAQGIGGGIQLVFSFVPVIGAMFLALSFLEDVGYMARAAFVVDRLMKSLGLPGKSFVPLIVGFGCNVPSIMATRSLSRESDRLITSLMAPFMSCSARLTVYTLFVAAFFSQNGQNIVFALYIIGILVAIFTAWIIRNFMLPTSGSSFVMELPPYLIPTGRNLMTHTWNRLRGFVKRAGKAIVAVVIILNFIGSVGVDGSIGTLNRKDSMLAAFARSVTPVFTPMGITEDNWPATVGIITGTFAKEVVVGTMNALYSRPEATDNKLHILSNMKDALQSIPDNLADVVRNLDNPLMLHVANKMDAEGVLKEQGVSRSTISQMQRFFDGTAGAFSYMLFVLLYIPCATTMGAMYKEHGLFWMGFSMTWSLSTAYVLSACTYQILTFSKHPTSSTWWIAGLLLFQAALTTFVIKLGRDQVKRTGIIPAKHLE